MGGQLLACAVCLFLCDAAAGGLGVPGAYAGERSEWGRDAEPVLGRTQSGLIGEG